MGFLNESSKRRRRFLEISLKRLKYSPNGDLSTLSYNGDHTSSTTGVLINDLTISLVSDNGDLTTISSVSDNDYDLTSCIEGPIGDLTISSVSSNDNLTISSVIPNGDLTSSTGDSSDDRFKDIDEFLCARIDSSNESLPEPLIYSRCVTSDVLCGNASEVTETDSQFRIPLIGQNKEEYLLKEVDNEIQTSVLSSHTRIDSSSESLPDPGNNSPIVTSDVHIEASAQKSELEKGLIIPQIEQSKEYVLIESEHETRPSGLSSHAWIDSSCESLPDPENISHIVTSDAIGIAAKAESQTDNSLLIPQIELRFSEDELGESFDHMANRKIFKLVTKRKGVDVHQFEADDVTYSLKFPRLEEDVERSSDGEGELENNVSKQNNSDDLETEQVPEKINPDVLARSRAETKAQLLRAKREEREMLREYGRSAPYRRSRRGSKMMAYNRDINDLDSSDEDMEESSPLPKIHKPYSHYKRFIMVHRESKVYEQNVLNKLMSRKWTSSCDNPGSTPNISLKDSGNDDTSDHGNLDSDEQDCPPSPKSSKSPLKAPSSTEAVNMPVFDW